MPILAEHLSLHRYFLNASRNRSLFLQKLRENELDHLHTRVHLELWYACLFVVVEGWRKVRINEPAVTALLRDKGRLAILEGCRNAVFHYSSDYIDPRQDKLYGDEGFVDWVTALHDAISDFFLRDQ